ncbi:hypothetical protein RZE82_05695 [Mollicutes bacterium LVI A0039]|nr:hypothetical protein RZE82_05695 [Mollicutes bacterium LVI A0039]
MENKQLVEKYIGAIESSVNLKGTTDAQIYLVNNQYIVKTHISDGQATANWYQYNHAFAPQLVYGSNELLIYTYEHQDGNLDRYHIIDIFAKYNPKHVSICDEIYYSNLEQDYKQACSEFNLIPIKNNRPTNELSFHLHGDMGFHNLIVTNVGIKLIDPQPHVGSKAADLLQFYVSDPRIMKLMTITEISKYFDQTSFNYYFPLILADRIVRSSYHHPQDLEFYKKTYNSYISKIK